MSPIDNEGVDHALTVMAIGDVHLGTRPASVPSDLSGLNARELTPEAGLASAVERAIAEQVDAVLFAGDVVESSNARFEAMVPLETAVRQLLAADIQVFAVVGNHDVDSLPRLAASLDGFSLLGAAGHWQSVILQKHGQPALELIGWSFPERQVYTSPVAELLQHPLGPPMPGVPRLGVLHGDFNASGGPYAPFNSREIAATRFDAWVFGHIHRPSLAHADGLLHGYLGSLVGLDPSETGQHGPWLLRVAASGEISAQHLPTAALRWEELSVNVGVDEQAEDLGDRLGDECGQFAATLAALGCQPRALGIRIRLTGSSRHYVAIREKIEARSWREIRREVGSTSVFVDKVTDEIQLAIDLEEVARGDDPPALLARQLLVLRDGGAARRALLDRARRKLRATAESPQWRPLSEVREPPDPLSDTALLATLEAAGTAALQALLAQRGGSQAEASESS